jgi:hypothetical protein
MNVG